MITTSTLMTDYIIYITHLERVHNNYSKLTNSNTYVSHTGLLIQIDGTTLLHNNHK